MLWGLCDPSGPGSAVKSGEVRRKTGDLDIIFCFVRGEDPLIGDNPTPAGTPNTCPGIGDVLHDPLMEWGNANCFS